MTPTAAVVCRKCDYSLYGLRAVVGPAIVCPECGFAGLPRQIDPRAPLSWARMMARLCVPTALLCSGALASLSLWPVLSLMLATLAFLSGPVVPLVRGPGLAERRERGSPRQRSTAVLLVAAGWFVNAAISAAFLGVASVLPRPLGLS